MTALSSGRFTPHGTYEAEFRVYYEDTDAAGVVYYANYLKFADRARTEALRAAGIEQGSMLAAGQGGFVVRRASVEYHAPAMLDDVLTVEAELLSISRVRLTMRQSIRRGGELLASVEVEIVMVGANKRPMRMPTELSEALGSHLRLLEDK